MERRLAGAVELAIAVGLVRDAAEPRTHKGDDAGAAAHAVEKGVRDPKRRHRIGYKHRRGFLAGGAGGVAAALWRNAGIDKDEIEFETVEPAAQRGDLRIVIDVEVFDPDIAAGVLRPLFQPALPGLVAHGRDDIPAAVLQLGREPQPQPARRPNNEGPPVISHRTASRFAACVLKCKVCTQSDIGRHADVAAFWRGVDTNERGRSPATAFSYRRSRFPGRGSYRRSDNHRWDSAPQPNRRGIGMGRQPSRDAGA